MCRSNFNSRNITQSCICQIKIPTIWHSLICKIHITIPPSSFGGFVLERKREREREREREKERERERRERKREREREEREREKERKGKGKGGGEEEGEKGEKEGVMD